MKKHRLHKALSHFSKAWNFLEFLKDKKCGKKPIFFKKTALKNGNCYECFGYRIIVWKIEK